MGLIQLGCSSKTNIATASREYGYLLFLKSSSGQARPLRQIPKCIASGESFGRSGHKRLNDVVRCRWTNGMIQLIRKNKSASVIKYFRNLIS